VLVVIHTYFGILGLLLVAAIVVWRLGHRRLSDVEEFQAQRLRDLIGVGREDTDDYGSRPTRADDGHVTSDPEIVRRLHRGRFLAALVRHAKTEFGTPLPIESNRLAVRRFVRELMVERGLRPTHQLLYLDLVVEWVFIPSDQEIVALRTRESVAAREQHARARFKDGLLYRLLSMFYPATPPIPVMEG
jgi:hypothetical protein